MFRLGFVLVGFENGYVVIASLSFVSCCFLFQVSDEELIRCMDLVSLILSPCQLTTNSRVTKCKKRHRDESSAKKRRRAEPDDDDVYEAIKWLYHEEQSDAVSAVTMVTCSGEHRQDEVPAVMVASLAVAN